MPSYVRAGIRKCARIRALSTTVVKYADRSDYSPKSSDGARAGSSLVDDGYAAIVDGWLTAGLATACWTVS